MKLFLIFLLLMLAGCGKTFVNTHDYIQLEKNLSEAEIELDRIRNTPPDTVVTIEKQYLPSDTVFKTHIKEIYVGRGISWHNTLSYTIKVPFGVVGLTSDNYYSDKKFSQFITLDDSTTFWNEIQTEIDGAVQVSSSIDKARIKVLEAENSILRDNQDSMIEKIIKLLIGLTIVIGVLFGGYKIFGKRKG